MHVGQGFEVTDVTENVLWRNKFVTKVPNQNFRFLAKGCPEKQIKVTSHLLLGKGWGQVSFTYFKKNLKQIKCKTNLCYDTKSRNKQSSAMRASFNSLGFPGPIVFKGVRKLHGAIKEL